MRTVPDFERMLVEDRPADDVCGAARTLWISEPGGLTQFGALIEVLPPGSRSSLKHWHSAEDEMVYVLDGEVTLIEGDAALEKKINLPEDDRHVLEHIVDEMEHDLGTDREAATAAVAHLTDG